MVVEALEQAAGNVSHAAEALGITRAALYRRIEKFGL
jgi:transcriptional regulator of acetoin/glycerol metabolism